MREPRGQAWKPRAEFRHKGLGLRSETEPPLGAAAAWTGAETSRGFPDKGSGFLPNLTARPPWASAIPRRETLATPCGWKQKPVSVRGYVHMLRFPSEGTHHLMSGERQRHV